MKIHYLLFLFLFGILTTSQGQTTLPGGVMSGSIKASGSPYKVTGDILVPKDSTLIIEAGVVLDFDSAKLIRIDGTLKSLGTKENPNLFTCSDSLLGWHGLFFLESKDQDTCNFRYTEFEYISYPGDIINSPLFDTSYHSNGQRYRQTLIVGYNSAPLEFKHCTFYRNWQTFVIWDGSVVIDSCLIKGNLREYGLYGNGRLGGFHRCYVKLTNNYFYNNQASFFQVSSNSQFKDPGVVSDNIFIDNEIEFSFYSTNVPVLNCYWLRNRCKAVRLAGGNEQLFENCVFDSTYGSCLDGGDVRVAGSASRTVFRNCIFKNISDETFSVVVESVSPVFEACSFENNRYGLAFTPTSSKGRLINCTFRSNEEAMYVGSKIQVVNCNYINNQRTIKAKKVFADLDSTSPVARVAYSGHPDFFNCLFVGNKNYFGETRTLTFYTKPDAASFNNCLVEEGKLSIKMLENPRYNFSGTFNNCDSSAPTFVDATNHDYRLISDCNGTSVGFDQGYSDLIPMQYFENTVDDILKTIGTDKNGESRIYGDAPDIGAFEIQSIGSRIDWEDTLKDAEVCLGEDIQLKASARSLGLKANWQRWNGSSWVSTGESGASFNLTSVKSSDDGRKFRIQYDNECGLSRTTNEVTLSVHTPKKLTLPNDTTILHNQSYTIKAPSGFLDYQWSNDSTSHEIMINGRELGEGTFTFSLSARDENNCTSQDEIVITINRNSAAGTPIPSAIRMYPIPTSDFIKVDGEVQGLSFEIWDLTGRIISKNQPLTSTIDLNELVPGQYIMNVNSAVHHQFIQIVKK